MVGRACWADSCQQIRISSAALPAGENVPSTVRGGLEPQDHGVLGGTSCRAVKACVSVNREDLLKGGYCKPRDTHPYLDPDVKGKSQQGYLWTYSRPGGDVCLNGGEPVASRSGRISERLSW